MKRLKLSAFGQRFTRDTGALELMDDLGNAMNDAGGTLMLGGGNPGRVPAVMAKLAARLREVAGDERELNRMLGNYAHPRGEQRFRDSLARLLASELGWSITADNIALTGGSQSAFFLLFNLFGGEDADGVNRRIVLPLTPEYVGYSDVGIGEALFVSTRPVIDETEAPFFKYRPDFDALVVDATAAAVCVSRPTNPTGNVLTREEMTRLDAVCRECDVPLIVDAAYGLPFPGIVFVDSEPFWNENVIYCLSLSKLGLPAVRTGIVVAQEEVIDALTRMTAITSLAVGSVGPVLVQPWIESGEILSISRDHIQPFYRDKALRACDWLVNALDGVPFRIHEPEGALFLWLWFPDLPITSDELYRRLKSAGVFVLSGTSFFPGLATDWRHRNECLRLSYAQDDDVVRRGIEILGRELRAICR